MRTRNWVRELGSNIIFIACRRLLCSWASCVLGQDIILWLTVPLSTKGYNNYVIWYRWIVDWETWPVTISICVVCFTFKAFLLLLQSRRLMWLKKQIRFNHQNYNNYLKKNTHLSKIFLQEFGGTIFFLFEVPH